VLIFSVAALTLVLTLLSLTSSSAKVKGEQQRDKALLEVARYGFASAVAEINMDRQYSTGDLSGNGLGCTLVYTDASGVKTRGYPVYDADGRLLGRYTTMVDTKTVDGASKKIISVVAIRGDYPADWATAQAQLAAGRLQYVCAEAEIKPGSLEYDRNALSIRGNAMAGGTHGIHGKSNQVYIRGAPDGIVANAVPAVNISDKSAYDEFVKNDNIKGWGEVTGLNPTTGTITPDTNSERPNTVTNTEAGLLNQDTLDKIADGIDTRVTQVINGTGDYVGSKKIDAAAAAAGGTLSSGT
jgi:hypothetical protein